MEFHEDFSLSLADDDHVFFPFFSLLLKSSMRRDEKQKDPAGALQNHPDLFESFLYLDDYNIIFIISELFSRISESFSYLKLAA